MRLIPNGALFGGKVSDGVVLVKLSASWPAQHSRARSEATALTTPVSNTPARVRIGLGRGSDRKLHQPCLCALSDRAGALRLLVRAPSLRAKQNAVPLAFDVNVVNSQLRPVEPLLIVRQGCRDDLLIHLCHKQQPVRAVE